MTEKKAQDVTVVGTKEAIPVVVKGKIFSDTVIVAMITGLVSLISLYMTLKINGQQKVIKENLHDVHQQINSRMDELLKTTKEASRAKGFMEGAGTVDSSTTELDSSKIYKIIPAK